MSSLLREEMQRVLFRPAKQRLVEFIEIEEPSQGKHFLCVSVGKNKLVQLSIVGCHISQTPHKSGSKKIDTKRSSIQDSYKRTEIWSLQDLTLIDGRDPDVDDPCFLLHFDKVRKVTAISCSAKYSMVRALVALSDQHCQRSLNLQNFDWAYIKPTSFYSNRGDCVVLSQICFYALNLVSRTRTKFILKLLATTFQISRETQVQNIKEVLLQHTSCAGITAFPLFCINHGHLN